VAGSAATTVPEGKRGAPQQSPPDQRAVRRVALAWTLAVAGLLAYNWWVLVPFKPGLMRSPSELFSNLEVTGLPYATAMQRADLSSGILLLAAFLVAGNGTVGVAASARRGRLEWLAMMGFAIAGAAGGLWPEVCNDTSNATCRRLEWRFQLPADQYVHIVAGILEFTLITVALIYAVLRNRGLTTRFAVIYRRLLWSAVVAYPLLGAAYLSDKLGGVMEGVFFTGFTVLVATQIAERTRHGRVVTRSLRQAAWRPRWLSGADRPVGARWTRKL
jgi:FtsH-binding integral membrane protein